MELKQAIAGAFEEEVAALQGVLRIKSVECLGENGTVYGQGVADCLDYVLKLGASMGFAPRNVDGRCGYLEYGEGAELVTVLGHLDVVPEGTGWTYPPYGAEIHDGRIYARGAIDDKGPMMAALYALKAVKESGIALKRRVRLLFGLNEETGCACIRHYVEKGEELPAQTSSRGNLESISFKIRNQTKMPPGTILVQPVEVPASTVRQGKKI